LIELGDVQAEADAGLQLVYADGAVLRVDLKALVDGHPLLSALRDPLVFGTARVGEWGGSAVWGDDPDSDLELPQRGEARAAHRGAGLSGVGASGGE
jgi:hypothetical protein